MPAVPAIDVHAHVHAHVAVPAVPAVDRLETAGFDTTSDAIRGGNAARLLGLDK